MKVRILKGTNEIGGNCVELGTLNTTILLDYGTALAKDSKNISLNKPVDAIVISHPHQDHFGEIVHVDADIPIYCGELSFNLINSTRIFTGKDKVANTCHFFKAWEKFTIGDFTIEPYLVDHSAVDAYAFLIKANNKTLLYTGDFRSNGRKSVLFHNMCTNKALQNVDILIMEGTMMRRDNLGFEDEISVENKMLEVLQSNTISFLIASSQNIDRIVSAYRACKRAGRYFVVDIYTAWILELVSQNTNVPNISWRDIKVIKNFGGSYYKKIKEDPEYFKNFTRKLFQDTVSLEELACEPSKYFVKISPYHIKRLTELANIQDFNIIYSQWLGYMKDDFSSPSVVSLYKELQENSNWIYAHTGGHADLEILKKFAQELKPKKLIPIHTEYKEEFINHFDNVVVLNDGEQYDIGKF